MTRLARRRRRRTLGAGGTALALGVGLLLAVGAAGSAPHAAANPTGQYPSVYMTGSGPNGPTVDDLSLNQITGDNGEDATPVGLLSGDEIGPVAMNAAATLALVAYSVDSDNPYQAEIINVKSGGDAANVDLAGSAVGIAMDPVNVKVAFVVETNFNEGGQIQEVNMGVSPPTVATVPSDLGRIDAPTSIAISPNGEMLYVSGGNGNFRGIEAVPVSGPGITIWSQAGVGPVADLAIAPNGGQLFGVAPNAVFSLGLPLTVNETPHINGIKEPSDPVAVTVSPNGQTVYAGGISGLSSAVAGFAAANLAAAGAVTVPIGNNDGDGGGLQGMSVSPDGATLVAYGTNFDSITGAAATVLQPVSLAPNLHVEVPSTSPGLTGTTGPEDIAMTPDQAPHAAFSATVGEAGHPTTFLAGGTVAYGSVTTFAWNFGDGTTATTHTSTFSHTYAAAGSYQVTLIETDSAGASIAPAVPGTSFAVNGPGQTPYSMASPLARITHPVTVPAAPPPSSTATTATTTIITPATTSTTTSSTTTGHGSTTTTTVAGHPASGGATLVLNPAVGPPGTIVTVTGSGFLPNTPVTVSWSVSTGSVVIPVNAQGDLRPSYLYILTPDLLGPRFADASGTRPATAAFLVVPSTSEPGGDDGDFLFRSEGP